jgi:hypothetical protein
MSDIAHHVTGNILMLYYSLIKNNYVHIEKSLIKVSLKKQTIWLVSDEGTECNAYTTYDFEELFCLGFYVVIDDRE